MKRVAILGATGSIGVQALELIRTYPDAFQVVALAVGNNAEALLRQTHVFRPRCVAVRERGTAAALEGSLPAGVEVCWGESGLERVATYPEADVVLSAIVGAAGLRPTLAAVRAGKDVALANKESLVMGGGLLTAEAAARGVQLLPVDSEHSAIFQCLDRGGRTALRRIILTASGGPFREVFSDRLAEVRPEDALRHPTWTMGRKITIDSATLMNKGLEMIEACWLFGLRPHEVDVVIHPQSVVHSLVEYVDRSCLAQLSMPDMRLPILYALSYPERMASELPALDLTRVGQLGFEPVDHARFPCLGLAYAAAEAGGTMPIALNAANEVAVDLFLRRQIRFTEIPAMIEAGLNGHRQGTADDLETILGADREVRDRLTRGSWPKAGTVA